MIEKNSIYDEYTISIAGEKVFEGYSMTPGPGHIYFLKVFCDFLKTGKISMVNFRECEATDTRVSLILGDFSYSSNLMLVIQDSGGAIETKLFEGDIISFAKELIFDIKRDFKNWTHFSWISGWNTEEEKKYGEIIKIYRDYDCDQIESIISTKEFKKIAEENNSLEWFENYIKSKEFHNIKQYKQNVVEETNALLGELEAIIRKRQI